MIHRFLYAFWGPLLATVVGLVAVLWWGGAMAFAIAILLVILEVTLSFDNAVVNAKVLKQLSEKWQHRFLTWGILLSVVLTRALLPIAIVAISTGVSYFTIANIALNDPEHYGKLLEGAHVIIASFGGIFLTLVGLRYFFDKEKQVHWIQSVEKKLAEWGTIESVVIGLALLLLFIIAFLLPDVRTEVLFSGLAGVLVFVLLQGIISAFGAESLKLHHTGLALFVYLNVLDAAFSLDSVVGAFALSTQLPVIIVGLGVGAYFVRSLTVYMVQHKVLDELIYIEHGAHWAIIGLAGAMLGSMFVNLPEPITGLIGLVLVILAYISSIRIERKRAENG
ncbi:MAG: DUF475 domain-containing protein [bacterium]|nr:DUF475 domain-containing protein [bacterium]